LPFHPRFFALSSTPSLPFHPRKRKIAPKISNTYKSLHARASLLLLLYLLAPADGKIGCRQKSKQNFSTNFVEKYPNQTSQPQLRPSIRLLLRFAYFLGK